MIKSARFTQLALSWTSKLNNKWMIIHNNNSNRMLQWVIEWKHDTGKIHVQNHKTLKGAQTLKSKYKIGRALFVFCVSQLFSLVDLHNLIYQWCFVIINANSHKELVEEMSGRFYCWMFNCIHWQFSFTQSLYTLIPGCINISERNAPGK